jgi:anti-sigma B factor antagonist
VASRTSLHVDSHQAGHLVVSVRGELDLAGRDEVEPGILAAVHTATAVVLDLGDLTFCDSIGIALLLEASEQAEGSGCHLTIRNLLPNIWRLLEIAGVHERLTIETSTRTAPERDGRDDDSLGV